MRGVASTKRLGDSLCQIGPQRTARAFNACGRWSWDVKAGVRPAEKPRARGVPQGGSGGGQDLRQVGDGSGEIELGGGLVTPDVPGPAADPIAQAGPGDAPRPVMTWLSGSTATAALWPSKRWLPPFA